MNNDSTLPKPFVFVLMPFDGEFSDIYKFGIKGAAEEAGAYAERVDEQIFDEGILDRIFSQINKADVVVADMTGRNPNVFYEVGYAHALGKTVLLLTQAAEDIPFDLKHRPHIVYGGKIDDLKRKLIDRIRWAIENSNRDPNPTRLERLALFVLNVEAINSRSPEDVPTLKGEARRPRFSIPIQLRNDSSQTLSPITHVYLFSRRLAALVPTEKHEPVIVQPTTISLNPTGYVSGLSAYHQPEPLPLEPMAASVVSTGEEFDVQFRLPITFPCIPSGAIDVADLGFIFREGVTQSSDLFRLRVHTAAGFHEFYFRLCISIREGGNSIFAPS